MKKRSITLFALLSIAVFITVGCGGGSDSNTSSGGDSGSGTTVTNTESQQIAAALAEASTQAFVGGGGLSLSNSAVPSDGKFLLIKTPPITAASISVTEANFCTGGSLENLSTLTPLGTATMNGSDLGSDGRGTCSVKVYGSNDDATYLLTDLVYTEFSGGSATDNVTMDGEIQLSMIMTQSGNHISLRGWMLADSILVGFIEGSSTRVCEVNPLNISQTSTYDMSESSVTYTSEFGGCMKVCDSFFDVSGTSSAVVTLPN